ncbi:MAG: hypothetical protein QF476_07320 [Dehalococcoidia bacterium]|nr:hypothetical protein [Dehalococcoidia bacterium]
MTTFSVEIEDVDPGQDRGCECHVKRELPGGDYGVGLLGQYFDRSSDQNSDPAEYSDCRES